MKDEYNSHIESANLIPSHACPPSHCETDSTMIKPPISWMENMQHDFIHLLKTWLYIHMETGVPEWICFFHCILIATDQDTGTDLLGVESPFPLILALPLMGLWEPGVTLAAADLPTLVVRVPWALTAKSKSSRALIKSNTIHA